MKGKGKGDRSSTSEYKTEKADSPIVSCSDISLVDHAKHCPRYTAGQVLFVISNDVSFYLLIKTK